MKKATLTKTGIRGKETMCTEHNIHIEVPEDEQITTVIDIAAFKKKKQELTELWLKQHPDELDMVRSFFKGWDRRKAAEACAESFLEVHPELYVSYK